MYCDSGGWPNWSMILVEKYPCNDQLDATKRERYWYEQLNATLNSQVPSSTLLNTKTTTKSTTNSFIKQILSNYSPIKNST